MKKIAILAVLLVVSSFTFAQKIELNAKVDERCELLSTVFRLAEAREYMDNRVPVFVDNVVKHFEPYKNHEIVEFSKVLRRDYGVSYDAVMSLAVHLQIENGKISLISNVGENSLESRWHRDSLPRYMELLNDFYTVTKFHDFFVQQADFVEKFEQAATEYFKKINMEWFKNFFGEVPDGSFKLVISLSNGSSNYGSKVSYLDNREDLYSILGGSTDSLNNPLFNDDWALELIIHEFSHSFCNPLIVENYSEMKEKADVFFALNEDVFRRQAYGSSQTMLYEILVRASVIKYMADHFPEMDVKNLLNREKSNGFLWIEELYNSFDKYEQNREKYPTLRMFMPEIVKILNELNPEKIHEERQKLMPTMSVNIENNDENVDASTTTQIIVKFDKKMSVGNNGASFGDKGRDYMPKILGAKWNEETKTEWIIDVQLEPNREYSISFPAQFFRSEDGVSPKNTISLNFKTK